MASKGRLHVAGGTPGSHVVVRNPETARSRGRRRLTVIVTSETPRGFHSHARAKGRRPTVLVLTRQSVPTLDRSLYAPAAGLGRGAYVLDASHNDAAATPDILLIASGSEVALIVAAGRSLRATGVRARLVSMPCWRLFEEQSAEYRESVLPARVTARLAVEAASPLGWERWTGLGGGILGIDRFGASAPGAVVMKEYGFTVDHVVERARALLGIHEGSSAPRPLG